jgi:RHS repeat-associated protein
VKYEIAKDLKFISDLMLFSRDFVELDGTNDVLTRSYVWGLDPSGTMDGALGVGGFLWVTLHTASGAAAGTHFCAYDGNGNVVALVSASDGSSTARYEYGPFGEPIRVTGPAATLNPFRFSTKRTCNTTDLVLYEYRAYNPIIGRWLSRDPIEEWGCVQLYAFVRNAPSILWDADGRFTYLLHLRITSDAGRAAGISSKCVLKIALASANTDIWHFRDHSYHFTRPVRGDKKEAYRKSMDRMGELLGKVCELAQKGNCREALKSLGTGLHIAQDYYSHVYNGEPVSYDLLGRYPPDDDPNHRDHGRDKDPFQAFLATIDSLSILADKKSCLGCCCKN